MKTFYIAFFALLGILVPSACHAGQIPDDVLQKHFGPKHTFKLKVLGPDPEFTQAGYTFKVTIDGLELSKEVYYDVSVYIGVDETFGTGAYRLYSTAKDHYSVEILLVTTPVAKTNPKPAPPAKRSHTYSPERNPQGEIVRRA